jgi:glycosyltransferase involved in cell wall biosynthesis
MFSPAARSDDAATMLSMIPEKNIALPPALVSVGVPVHNGGEHLEEALRSVLTQDYPNLEVVICDNASDDGTEALCRRIAAEDHRVRYLRNETNIGLMPNFRRSLDEARGRYFSWLAHDDVISNRAYLSTLVAYMEENPDVVACTSAFQLLNSHFGMAGDLISVPEIAPHRWPEGRQEYFRWPHGWIESLTIYGVFRTSDLRQISLPERSWKGRPHIFWWETDVTTALCLRGRIVALPNALRSYRLAVHTAGTGMSTSFSTFDLYRIGLRIKLILIGRATRAPGSLTARLRLVGTAVANLFRANLGQPYDHAYVTRNWGIAVRALEGVARERAAAVESLKALVQTRRKAAEEIGVAPGPISAEVEGALMEPEVDLPEPADPPPNSWAAAVVRFFRPPTSDEIRRRNELQARMGELNLLCARMLSVIEVLNAEAQRLAQLLEQAAAAGRPTPG